MRVASAALVYVGSAAWRVHCCYLRDFSGLGWSGPFNSPPCLPSSGLIVVWLSSVSDVCLMCVCIVCACVLLFFCVCVCLRVRAAIMAYCPGMGVLCCVLFGVFSSWFSSCTASFCILYVKPEYRRVDGCVFLSKAVCDVCHVWHGLNTADCVFGRLAWCVGFGFCTFALLHASKQTCQFAWGWSFVFCRGQGLACQVSLNPRCANSFVIGWFYIQLPPKRRNDPSAQVILP